MHFLFCSRPAVVGSFWRPAPDVRPVRLEWPSRSLSPRARVFKCLARRPLLSSARAGSCRSRKSRARARTPYIIIGRRARRAFAFAFASARLATWPARRKRDVILGIFVRLSRATRPAGADQSVAGSVAGFLFLRLHRGQRKRAAPGYEGPPCKSNADRRDCFASSLARCLRPK